MSYLNYLQLDGNYPFGTRHKTVVYCGHKKFTKSRVEGWGLGVRVQD